MAATDGSLVASKQHVETDITLCDGTCVHLRPIRPEDDHALVEAFHRMSAQTIYQRFFAALPELSDDMAHHLSHLDSANRMAVVAEIDGRVAAVGRYERTSDPEVVELGLVVLDEFQDRGLGRVLLRATLDQAGRHGIRSFRAEVLSENPRMLHLLASEMHIRESHSQSGVTTLLLDPLKTGTAKIDS
jgi:GNAT superfamily N-acetyltransferase